MGPSAAGGARGSSLRWAEQLAAASAWWRLSIGGWAGVSCRFQLDTPGSWFDDFRGRRVDGPSGGPWYAWSWAWSDPATAPLSEDPPTRIEG